MQKQERWMVRIPVSKEGDEFLKLLRKYMNRETYSIYTHYTGPRPKGTSQHSTTRENATSRRVYIDRKDRNESSFAYIQRGRDIEKGLTDLRLGRLSTILDRAKEELRGQKHK